MRILVTGATGFTGSHVVPSLLGAGAAVRCFVRAQSDLNVLPRDKVQICYGDLTDSNSLRSALEGMDALVNVASIGFGHAEGIVAAAVDAGVRRAIFFSSTALFTTLNARSKSIRIAAEQEITESSLQYTILRPTMIYGSARDRNISRLIKYLKRWPVLPVIGSGEFLQQPVYVRDLSIAVANCLDTPKTVRACYNLSGAEPLSFNHLVETICDALRSSVWLIHFPMGLPVAALRLAERFPWRLPLRSEQLLRLNEDKAFSHERARDDFGFAPLPFSAGVALQIREMGLMPEPQVTASSSSH